MASPVLKVLGVRGFNTWGVRLGKGVNAARLRCVLGVLGVLGVRGVRGVRGVSRGELEADLGRVWT